MEKLRLRGEKVRCLVRPATNVRRLPEGVETAAGDLAGGLGLDRALENVDTVIHAAGVTKALSSADYFTANARSTETLVRALDGQPTRLVYVSSLAAIGPSPDGKPVNEDAVPNPVSSYGRSKLEGEKIAGSRPNTVIVRPPVVYGPRDTDVFQILKAVSQGLVVEIAGASGGLAQFMSKTWPRACAWPRARRKRWVGLIFWLIPSR